MVRQARTVPRGRGGGDAFLRRLEGLARALDGVELGRGGKRTELERPSEPWYPNRAVETGEALEKL